MLAFEVRLPVFERAFQDPRETHVLFLLCSYALASLWEDVENTGLICRLHYYLWLNSQIGLMFVVIWTQSHDRELQHQRYKNLQRF
jgi:hypothetical protein